MRRPLSVRNSRRMNVVPLRSAIQVPARPAGVVCGGKMASSSATSRLVISPSRAFDVRPAWMACPALALLPNRFERWLGLLPVARREEAKVRELTAVSLGLLLIVVGLQERGTAATIPTGFTETQIVAGL